MAVTSILPTLSLEIGAWNCTFPFSSERSVSRTCLGPRPAPLLQHQSARQQGHLWLVWFGTLERNRSEHSRWRMWVQAKLRTISAEFRGRWQITQRSLRLSGDMGSLLIRRSDSGMKTREAMVGEMNVRGRSGKGVKTDIF